MTKEDILEILKNEQVAVDNKRKEIEAQVKKHKETFQVID